MVDPAAAKPGEALTYTSPRPVYVGGHYLEPGTPFSTGARPSAAWVVTGEDRGAAASVNRTPVRPA